MINQSDFITYALYLRIADDLRNYFISLGECNEDYLGTKEAISRAASVCATALFDITWSALEEPDNDNQLEILTEGLLEQINNGFRASRALKEMETLYVQQN